jgi:hypothetical protein
MPALESNIYALWVAVQASGKGTAAVSAEKRLIQVAGDLENARADGAEAFSDLEQFGNMQDFTNTIIGQGSPGCEAASDALAYLCFAFFGSDTATGGTESEQTIGTTVTGGTWGLTVGFGQLQQSTPVTLPATATNVEVAAALNALSVVKAAGEVTATGGPVQTTPIVVKFKNPTLGNFKMTVTLGTGTLAPTITMTAKGKYASRTFVPAIAGSKYITFWKRVGGTTVLRQKFADCRVAQLSIEGSTAAKVVRITPTIISLKPGVVFAEAEENVAGKPFKLQEHTVNLINDPFMYTEGAGKYKIGGVVFHGQTQFNITWDYGYTPVYGDQVTPFDLVPGLGKITVATTLIVDQAGLEEYNRIIYGESTPAAGKAPLETLPAMGSYEATLKKESTPGEATNQEEFKVIIPAVHWTPGLSIAPNPQGGAVELPLAGEMRRNQGTAASTVTLLSPDAASYVGT